MAAAELAESRPDVAVLARPGGCGGLVRAELDRIDDLLRLTTVHHVLELRAEGVVAALEPIADAVGAADFSELAGAPSFRVRSKRVGDHGFRSGDIERAAGAVLHRRYGTPVDLEGFAVEVRVDLHGERLFAGIGRTRTSLGRRILRDRNLRSALKPTVAAAMLRLAGAHRGAGRLIDPMCGTGTIPIEAKRVNPALEVTASDWDAATVASARRTVARHDLAIEVREADARTLAAAHPMGFDYIVTDPPYGVRQARHTSRTRLYASLLAAFEGALAESGRVVLVVLKYAAFLGALERCGLTVVHERRVELGTIAPRIVVLAR